MKCLEPRAVVCAVSMPVYYSSRQSHKTYRTYTAFAFELRWAAGETARLPTGSCGLILCVCVVSKCKWRIRGR